jgi:hypothetical protein
MSVTELPLVAATIKGSKASIFVVEDGKAKAMSVAVKGEASGKVYLAQDLKPGSKVVTEGRALLNDGDPVNAKVAAPPKEEKKDEKKEEKKDEKKPEPAPSATHGGKAP